MGYPSNIGRVYVKQQSAVGTAEDTFSDSDTVGADVALPPLVAEALVSETLRGDWHAHATQEGSRQGAEFPISHVLQGFSASTPGADPTEHPDALLLRSVMGAAVQAGYNSGQLSGGTASSLEFGNGSLLPAWAGGAFLVPLVGGKRGWAWAETIVDGDPGILTPVVPLSAAPDPTGTPVVYGSNVIYQDRTTPTVFTVQWIGGDANAGVRFSDCGVISSKLVVTNAQLPRITHQVRANYWAVAGGTALSQYLLSHPELPKIVGANGGRYYSEDAAAEKTIPSVEIDITAALEPQGGIGFNDGWGGNDVANREVMVTVKELSSNMATELKTVGQEVGAVQIDLCTTPGRACSVLLPNAKVEEQQKYEDGNGMVVLTTIYKARPHTTDTAAGVAGNSPFRIAFG